jgi:hypothetical protein
MVSRGLKGRKYSFCSNSKEIKNRLVVKQQGSKFKSLIKEVIIMAENPLKIIEKLDLELFKNVETTQTLALGAGALPRKVKLLMAMALDASHGCLTRNR